jgi:two-component system, OmpR family, sensor histidine kinase KdpD
VNISDPDRPSPDALLRLAKREARGRLKIFLGAAPGVGKTYAMLSQGAERLRAGVDVVIGIVETHGRAETQALVQPLEVIPRKQIDYQGRVLTEMDIDAVLARRPTLVLVDELAHTNAPESRHPKRWQDVEELLDAGIDVLSTLNVQHIESLNDVVAGFTRVRVRETVPDAVVENAELEVVDLPPEELIERLKAGKVYVPQEASRALGHFFSKPNLSALRELALRRAAQTVDARMLDDLRASAISGTYAGGDRILVAVSEQPGSEILVRTAKRLADALHAPWTAVYVETPQAERIDPAEREQLSGSLSLASSLGATLATVPAANVAAGLVAQVAEMRATQVVLGKSRRRRWLSLHQRSLLERLIDEFEGVAVHVLPIAEPRRAPKLRPAAWGERPAIQWRPYLLSMSFVALTTVLAILLNPLVGVNAIDLIYLLPVLAAATLFGLRPGVVVSLASALAYNFFFLDPLYTFTIENPQNALTFFSLTAVAIVASHLAGRLRTQATIGARSARENAALAALAQTLAQVSDAESTAAAVCSETSRLLDLNTVLLGQQDGQIRIIGSHPPRITLDPVDIVAADWAFSHGEPTGHDTRTLNASDWQYHPLKTSLGVLAVLGIARDDGKTPVPADRVVLLTTIIGQAALAHERLWLERDMRELTVLNERDRLRATLLSSIGHDLRTPLTAVVAAAQMLPENAEAKEQVETIKTESERLKRFFDDLIDMTRIESGALNIVPEATDLTDAVSAAVHDMRKALESRKVKLAIPPDLPLVLVDPKLLHHILINLLDNAAKYTAADTVVTIEARRTPDGVTLTVLDEGPGLPAGGESALFERFARVEGSDRVGGTGLGLAIVKGFAEGMGLAVSATNRPDRTGACFSVSIPGELLIVPKMNS